MVALPAEFPETKPLALTEATAALLLLHVPPGVAQLSVVVAPAQMSVVPVIDDGAELITTVALPSLLQHPVVERALK